jgi:DNA-directed RNA polymerase subunit beta
LIKELQSLGLDVKVLNGMKQEIDLKQSFEEDEEIALTVIDEDALKAVIIEEELPGFTVKEAENLDSDEEIFDEENVYVSDEHIDTIFDNEFDV